MRVLALLLATALAWGQSPPPAPAPASDPSVTALQACALAFAKKTAATLGGTYRFKVDQPPRLPVLPPGHLTFEGAYLSKQDPVGPFFVVVSVKRNGARAALARVDMEGSWVGHLLRARQDLPRKTNLSMAVLVEAPFEGVPPAGALTTLPPSQRLRMPLAEGHILTRSDLEPIPLVRPGERVRLTATSGPLTIALDTTARSRGSLGDKVRLESPRSRRIVQGVVTGPDEARLEN